MSKFDRAAVEAALREAGSIAAAARLLDVDRRRLSEFVNADAELKVLRWTPTGGRTGASTNISGDDGDITVQTDDLCDLERLIQGKGIDPDEWYVTAL